MTLLVFGAGGQVGRALTERAGAAARGLDHAACDICDAGAVARAVAAPGLTAVVNCAAYTAVDRAEGERAQAFAANRDGAAAVAQAAAARGLPVIHLSTDYVYAGMRPTGAGARPLGEDEPIAPVNAYGESKAAGDAAVAAANPKHVILRVSWVFGRHGANFVTTMLRLGREREELRVVDDQRGGPTEARDIADAVLAVASFCCRSDFSRFGVYHFAGTPSASWYEFAQAIFERANVAAPRLVPIATADYPTPARRPGHSVLDCGRIRRSFGLAQPDWRVALDRVLRELGAARA